MADSPTRLQGDIETIVRANPECDRIAAAWFPLSDVKLPYDDVLDAMEHFTDPLPDGSFLPGEEISRRRWMTKRAMGWTEEQYTHETSERFRRAR